MKRSRFGGRKKNQKSLFWFFALLLLAGALLFAAIGNFNSFKSNVHKGIVTTQSSDGDLTKIEPSNSSTSHEVLNGQPKAPNFLIRIWQLLYNFIVNLLGGNSGGGTPTPTPIAQIITPTPQVTQGPCNSIGPGIPSPATVGGLPCTTPGITAAPTQVRATATPIIPAPTPTISSFDSSNWAGYAYHIPSGSTSKITSTWNNSQVTCPNLFKATASPWVGIGGWENNDNGISQLGTDLTCSNGTAKYYAWTESYPDPTVYLNNPVSAGDTMTASVTYLGGGNFTTTINDVTKGWTATVPMSFPGDNPLTGEVILESYVDSSIVPQFQPPVNFTDNNLTINNGPQTPLPSGSGLNKVNIVNNNILQARTSAFNGSSFSITWVHN